MFAFAVLAKHKSVLWHKPEWIDDPVRMKKNPLLLPFFSWYNKSLLEENRCDFCGTIASTFHSRYLHICEDCRYYFFTFIKAFLWLCNFIFLNIHFSRYFGLLEYPVASAEDVLPNKPPEPRRPMLLCFVAIRTSSKTEPPKGIEKDLETAILARISGDT